MAGTDFGKWQKEKAIQALIDEAQAMADRLASAKPHAAEQQAAAAQFWARVYLAEGLDLTTVGSWKAADLTRFVRGAQSKIAALRKARDYVSSDGLTVWLHSARAVQELRIAPPVREIWAHLSNAGQNVEAMLADLLEDAGITTPPDHAGRLVPEAFSAPN